MTVVAGYTPDPQGDRVVDAAVQEARRREQPLVVVNASTGGTYTDSALATPEQLLQLRRRLSDGAADDRVLQLSESTNAAEALLATAEETGAGLLVIGLRSRSRTGKLLFGSTAQTVLLRAPCDVLAVRPDPAH